MSPAKESSAKLSSLAAKMLQEAAEAESRGLVGISFPIADIKALCGSVLSQDETEGQDEEPAPKKPAKKSSPSHRPVKK